MTNTQSPAPGVAADIEPSVRVVEKATCYAVHCGNEVIGSFAGPDCGEHAQLFATALQASAAAVEPVAWEVTFAAAGDDCSTSKIVTKYPACPEDYEKISPLYTAPPLPAQVQAMTRGEIDALVYQCRQDGDDTTYAIVNAAIASRTPAPGMARGYQTIEQFTDREIETLLSASGTEMVDRHNIKSMREALTKLLSEKAAHHPV